jgi:opacity protein-like surface antigen
MRRIRISTISAVATAVALVGWSVAASAMPKPFQIGFGGGVSVPVSDAKDALKTGWHGTAILKLNMPGLPLDLRGAFSYSHFNLDPASAGFDGTGRLLSGLANVSYSLPFPGPLHPYVTAGLGAFNLKADPSASGVPSPDSQTKFGIDGGAGVQFGLMGLHGFVEGKLQNIYTDQGFNSALAKDINTQIIPVTFGIFL